MPEDNDKFLFVKYKSKNIDEETTYPPNPMLFIGGSEKDRAEAVKNGRQYDELSELRTDGSQSGWRAYEVSDSMSEAGVSPWEFAL